MNSVRITGHVLLWIGFLSGAFVTVRSTENTADPWSTIAWFYYCGALMIGVVGVVLLRRTARQAVETSTSSGRGLEELAAMLDEFGKRLAAYRAEWTVARVYETHRWIDANLAESLAEFADHRQVISRLCGLRLYGQVMTDFAKGERQINRAWCASADGYADEVDRCLFAAQEAFEEAARRLQSHVRGADA